MNQSAAAKANSHPRAVAAILGQSVACVSFDSEKAQNGLKFAKEPDLVQEKIKPAIGDAVVPFK